MDYVLKQNAAPTNERAASRIENDVERVKMMATRVETIVSGIVRHARSLGYYEPAQTPPSTKPSAVITTLSDALSELDRALDNGSAALNLFE